jgi:transposase
MKKLKSFEESVGIDVSKLTLDVFIYTKNLHKQFPNNKKGFENILKWVIRESRTTNEIIWCFEHTGWYCVLLSHFMHENDLYYCCVNALEIKRSMGLKRGKTDKQDAKEIARFAWLRKDELERSTPMPIKLIELQRLMSLREQLLKQTTALKNLNKGMLVTIEKTTGDKALGIIKQSLKQMEVQIKKVESEMEVLLKTDDQLYSNYKLSKSVKGIGSVLAIQMLLHTHNYTRFKTWREFSAYCGIVPYPHQSGTSINFKPKNHSISDRKMKSLLTMSAISAIQSDKELKTYFKRRIEEGKHKMIVINIIRNKIVSRVFATVKRGTPFVELNKFAA